MSKYDPPEMPDWVRKAQAVPESEWGPEITMQPETTTPAPTPADRESAERRLIEARLIAVQVLCKRCPDLHHSDIHASITSGYCDQNDCVQSALAALSQAEARMSRMREALEEAEEVFALVEQPSFPDPVHSAAIEALGSRIGYGALMTGASALWRNATIARGGEFVAGPCHTTVIRTLEKIRAALNDGGGNG